MVRFVAGTTQAVPLDGTDAPAGGQAWDVTLGGSVIANTGSPAGWAVTGSGASRSVTAPSGATLGTYEVRTGSGSGEFDVGQLAAMADGGTLTDTLHAVRRASGTTEAAHVVDTIRAIVVAQVFDGGTFHDGTGDLISPRTVADGGTLTDAVGIGRFRMFDSAHVVTAERITRTDIGSGVSVSATFTQDFGTGTDVASASAKVPLSDGGHGTEAMAVMGPGGGLHVAQVTDGGTFTDSPTAPAQSSGTAFWWD